MTNSTNLGCQMSFQKGIIRFEYYYSNFDINNYFFFSSYETVVGKKIN